MGPLVGLVLVRPRQKCWSGSSVLAVLVVVVLVAFVVLLMVMFVPGMVVMLVLVAVLVVLEGGPQGGRLGAGGGGPGRRLPQAQARPGDQAGRPPDQSQGRAPHGRLLAGGSCSPVSLSPGKKAPDLLSS